MPQVLVVADDLTGAMDTAHGFATRGCDARVVVAPDDAARERAGSTAAVLAVNADTRYADPEAAAATVRGVVSGRDTTIYKKVDSTLRGNVVEEIDAAVDASGAAVALVAPAFPATGRATRGGVHRVDGIPVDRTEYADDEKGPAVADLPALLSASRYPVVRVGLDAIDRGPDAVAAAVDRGRFASGDDRHVPGGDRHVSGDDRSPPEGDRPVLVACDAATGEHLAAIARSADLIEGRVVFVGSGGLAEHVRVAGGCAEAVGALDPGEGDESTDVTDSGDGTESSGATVSGAGPDPIGDGERADGAVLGIVGSVNERTLAGLDAVPADEIVEIDPGTAVRDPETAGRTAGEAAAERLAAGERAVVTGARSRSAVDAALAAGDERGCDPAEVRRRVARTLAVAARTAVEGGSPAGLFVTGGDVAVVVFGALGATSVSLTGESVGAGIPIGVVDDGLAAGVPAATKAGGFGGAEAVVNCLRALSG